MVIILVLMKVDYGMLSILLLGDSIMYGAKGIHGYGYYLKQMLEGKADVYLPTDNCQDIRYLYSFADELIPQIDGEFDLIHWNSGLWDVLHFAGNPKPYTDIKTYGQHIDKFFQVLKQRYPMARIFFATTTPVPEHLQMTTSYRRNSEIIEYNSLAKSVLKGKVESFDDLFSAASKLSDDYRSSDGLHFSEEGAKILADSVYNFLSNRL